jgi:superfamily II DNA or RNA helicase
MQACGRALRPSPGKDRALIIDHVGAVRYHGLPDDPHKWTLDGVDKEHRDAALSVKTCPQCFRALRSAVPVCPPPCGFSFVKKGRDIYQVDGELEKVDKERARRAARMEQGMAQSLDDLMAIGVARYGQKNGQAWARVVHASRKAKRGLG